jgi:hypothetical protein
MAPADQHHLAVIGLAEQRCGEERMVFLLVAIVDGEAELACQRLERRDGPVALLGVGRREQRVDRGIGAAVALGVEEGGERTGPLIALGREMGVAVARLLAMADDQDDIRQDGSPALAATLCHARGKAPMSGRGDTGRCRRAGVHRLGARM